MCNEPYLSLIQTSSYAKANLCKRFCNYSQSLKCISSKNVFEIELENGKKNFWYRLPPSIFVLSSVICQKNWNGYVQLLYTLKERVIEFRSQICILKMLDQSKTETDRSDLIRVIPKNMPKKIFPFSPIRNSNLLQGFNVYVWWIFE